ncbi:hypothetical protein SAMN04487906_2174 [Zhouia amylolytica]|uniref:Uncharacterized protein n=1 Tax=Zhouia amylolytica TaxID=376730 RepID=A0A1I6TVM2_9FLAO|nr:hypothetical protein [Zhouia amylolytica]SFS93158.1 hypothetical protein SAMN04487906_2174 [Zhouia amylolytica]
MEATNKQLTSIWGPWWVPVRRWFYPAWLIYETSCRFYNYSIDVYLYIHHSQGGITTYIGDTATQVLAILGGLATFLICTAFLTAPTSFILFKFFEKEGLTGSILETQIKRFL